MEIEASFLSPTTRFFNASLILDALDAYPIIYLFPIVLPYAL